MRVPEADRIVSIAKVLEDDDEETTVDETVGSTELSRRFKLKKKKSE